MPTPETLTPREVAAWRLRQRLRVNIGPNARMLAETGQPLMLSGTEADDAVTVVLAALVEAGQIVMGASALADLVAERDRLKAEQDVARGMLTAARRHADEAKAESRERTLMAERLATRLAEHADCDEHTKAAPGRDCPFCEDRSTYLAFVAAGGRDYRDGSASQGEPVSIFAVRRHAIQQGDDREQ